MRSQLYLWKPLRQQYINDLTTIKDMFIERIQPIFANPESEAEKYKDELWERIMNRPCAEDEWADPDSQYLSACAASGVWDMLGRKGFITPDRLPLPGDCFSAGCIKYHLRRGRHFLSREDWQHYCTYILEL